MSARGAARRTQIAHSASFREQRARVRASLGQTQEEADREQRVAQQLAAAGPAMFEDIHEIAENSAYLKAVEEKV